MAFGSIAGRAGFELELDKSKLTRGLAQAEREFDQSTAGMAASASRAGAAVGPGSGLAGRLGMLAPMLARAGVIGLGISATVQGMNELESQLKTTGSEAFTTEGKLRNMSAALLSGNLIGGIKALSAAPKTLEDLGVAGERAGDRLSEASKHMDAVSKVADGYAARLREVAQVGENVGERTREQQAALDEYNRIVKEAGTGSQDLAIQLRDQARAWVDVNVAMRDVFNTAQGFRGPNGEVIVGGGFAGLRPSAPTVPPGSSILGPGAVPTPPTRTRGLPSILAQRESEAGRTDDLNDDLAVARDIAAFAKRRLDLVKQEGPLMEKRRREYQDALDKVDRAEDAIRADAERAADARRQAAERAAAERLRKQKERAAALLARRKAAAEKAKQLAEEAERQWEEVAIAMTSPSTWAEALAARSEAMNARFSLQTRAATAEAAEPGLTAADIRRMQFEFLQGLQGITNQFGGNLLGQTATNTWQSAKLTERLVGSVDRLTRGVQHPGARYARSELMMQFGDVGGV